MKKRPPFDDWSQFGEYLKDKRERAKLTQHDVAETLGYSTSQFVSNWERGLSRPPVRGLKKLAKILKIDRTELLNVVAAMERTKWEKLLS